MLWCASWQHTLTSSLFVVLIRPIHIAQSSAQSVWGTDSAVPAKLQHLLIPQHIQRHPAMGTSVMLSGLRWVCTKSHGCVSVAIGLAFQLLFLWCTSSPPVSIIEGKSNTWVVMSDSLQCHDFCFALCFVWTASTLEGKVPSRHEWTLWHAFYSQQSGLYLLLQPTHILLYGSAICSL